MAKLFINEKNRKGHINPEIYGHFSEHLGRCIYEGLYVGEDSEIPNVNGTIEGAFDDAMSVFQRDGEKRRAEIESQFAEAAPERPGSIIRDSIPFMVDELKAMLAVLESGN